MFLTHFWLALQLQSYVTNSVAMGVNTSWLLCHCPNSMGNRYRDTAIAAGAAFIKVSTTPRVIAYIENTT